MGSRRCQGGGPAYEVKILNLEQERNRLYQAPGGKRAAVRTKVAQGGLGQGEKSRGTPTHRVELTEGQDLSDNKRGQTGNISE